MIYIGCHLSVTDGYEAMEEARRAGVEILFLPCHVEPDSLEVLYLEDKR